MSLGLAKTPANEALHLCDQFLLVILEELIMVVHCNGQSHYV